MKRHKKTLKELIIDNKREIEMDLKALEKIEEKIEEKYAKKVMNS